VSLNLLIIRKARRLLNRLTSFLKDAKSVVIIGMGNELRGDDAIGLEVVRLIKPFTTDQLQVFEGYMTPEAFIRPACKAHPTHVLIIDAAELQAKPGVWRVLSSNEVEEGLFTTHAIPAVEVAAEIQRRCNTKVAFLGIQPKSREISMSLSKECQRAAKEIADSILGIIAART
jgi:hydrogenase 3 maturation protease